MRARRSKIARLPEPIRRELNQRLLDGQQGPQILPWLNALPEATRVIQEMGSAGGKTVTAFDDKNLSDWRNGGFQDWLSRRDQIAETRELADYAIKLAKAGAGDISEGAAAVLSGELLEIFEGLRDLRSGAEPAQLPDLSKAIDSVSRALASVRAGDHSSQKLALERERLKQADQSLALEKQKFQRLTCELFVKWSADQRAQAALAGSGDNTAKIHQLGQLIFGADWKE